MAPLAGPHAMVWGSKNLCCPRLPGPECIAVIRKYDNMLLHTVLALVILLNRVEGVCGSVGRTCCSPRLQLSHYDTRGWLMLCSMLLDGKHEEATI